MSLLKEAMAERVEIRAYIKEELAHDVRRLANIRYQSVSGLTGWLLEREVKTAKEDGEFKSD